MEQHRIFSYSDSVGFVCNPHYKLSTETTIDLHPKASARQEILDVKVRYTEQAYITVSILMMEVGTYSSILIRI